MPQHLRQPGQLTPPDKKGKKRLSNKQLAYLIWTLVCVTIIATATYPFISDYRLEQKQAAAIAKYDHSKHYETTKDYLKAFYRNTATKQTVEDPFSRTPAKKNRKNSVDVAQSELQTIGLISIPKLKETLPIYNGTSSTALDNGIGLLEGSSDLAGGKGKHAVLTGHRGLSLHRLFTDLPKLKLGDKFYLKVNGQIHAYQVDQIKTVLPTNLRYLQKVAGKDYVTLVTCTPLFTNTHRLLVRGHRIKYQPKTFYQRSGLTSLGKAALIAVGVILVAVLINLVSSYYRRKKNYKRKRRLRGHEAK